MANDYSIQQQEADFEEIKEENIQFWIRNGASPTDAMQLWEDMTNDPYHSDEDMSHHFDSTIDVRLAKFSKNANHN